MKKRLTVLIPVLIGVILAAALVVLLVRGTSKGGSDEEVTLRAVEGLDGIYEHIDNSTPTPVPTPTVTPNENPVLTLQETQVPADYFEDAVFIGDELVKGLEMYDYDNILKGATFYADESITLMGGTDYLADLEPGVYGKAYICLGMEELDYGEGNITQAFYDLIAAIREKEPDCIIYLMTLPPVSEYRSGVTGSSYTMEKIRTFNSNLLTIATDCGAYYMNIMHCLCNEDGYLPSDVTEDGVHFTPEHYTGWFEYLQTHYAVDTGEEDDADADEDADAVAVSDTDTAASAADAEEAGS